LKEAIHRYLPQIVIVASCFSIFLSVLLTACGSAVAASPVAPAEPPSEATAAVSTAVYQPTVDINKVMSSPDYGMQTFLYWRGEVADRDLRLVQEAGFRWVKQELAWRELEGGGKGKWRWNHADRLMAQIDAYGLKVIVRLGAQPAWASSAPLPEISPPDNLQDFYDYVFAVASRYKGRVEAYQLWNEPNLAREWGGRPPNPAEYVELLKVGYQAVKAADPQALVISAGMAPTTRHDHEAMPDIYFIQGMYEAGAAPYFDALGVHAPGFKSPPEIDPAVVAVDPALNNGDQAPEALRRVYAFRRVEDLRQVMVENGDEAKKVVILELGWTIDPRPESPYRWHAVDEITQAEYFKRAYRYAAEHWQPWVGVMSLIYVADPTWHMDDEETYWSIVYPFYPELRAAPAYYGLKGLEKTPPVEE
jgi:hypothetical protein